jgi:hypothetical protein
MMKRFIDKRPLPGAGSGTFKTGSDPSNEQGFRTILVTNETHPYVGNSQIDHLWRLL